MSVGRSRSGSDVESDPAPGPGPDVETDPGTVPQADQVDDVEHPGPVAAGTPATERTDVELLRAHVAGDRDAFAELFHRHRDRLWAVALRTLADREEAADALQEALLSAHRAAPGFRGDSAITTWLHRIVVNACLDRLRRRRAQQTLPLPDGSGVGADGRPTGVEPVAPAPDHETALVVRQALALLPVEQRTALILVDVQGYRVAEVAEMLGVAEGTVKSRCSRGRARLAVLLGQLHPGSPARTGGAPAQPTTGAGAGASRTSTTSTVAGSGNQEPVGRVRSRPIRPTDDGTQEEQ